MMLQKKPLSRTCAGGKKCSQKTGQQDHFHIAALAVVKKTYIA